MANASDTTHSAAQLARIHDELNAKKERAQLERSLSSGSGTLKHWALRRPGIFTTVERRSAADLTYREFYETFTLGRRPVILTGLDLYQDWNSLLQNTVRQQIPPRVDLLN